MEGRLSSSSRDPDDHHRFRRPALRPSSGWAWTSSSITMMLMIRERVPPRQQLLPFRGATSPTGHSDSVVVVVVVVVVIVVEEIARRMGLVVDLWL